LTSIISFFQIERDGECTTKGEKNLPFPISLIHVHRLVACLEKKKKRLSMCAVTNNQPMKKWSAQPTGNGKRIIIIITTLLLFRKCL